MTRPADYGCCDTLNAASAEPRTAGHHALCPRWGRRAIEARHAAGERGLFLVEPGGGEAQDDRGVLLQALQEREAELERLRPIVERVAGGAGAFLPAGLRYEARSALGPGDPATD